MSVSIREVIESAGYDLSTPDDARWFLSRANEIEELQELAEEVIDEAENE